VSEHDVATAVGEVGGGRAFRGRIALDMRAGWYCVLTFVAIWWTADASPPRGAKPSIRMRSTKIAMSFDEIRRLLSQACVCPLRGFARCGTGVVAHAGPVLLRKLADRTSLTGCLTERWRAVDMLAQ
jgi:hypothetical protein